MTVVRVKVRVVVVALVVVDEVVVKSIDVLYTGALCGFVVTITPVQTIVVVLPLL